MVYDDVFNGISGSQLFGKKFNTLEMIRIQMARRSIECVDTVETLVYLWILKRSKETSRNFVYLWILVFLCIFGDLSNLCIYFRNFKKLQETSNLAISQLKETIMSWNLSGKFFVVLKFTKHQIWNGGSIESPDVVQPWKLLMIIMILWFLWLYFGVVKMEIFNLKFLDYKTVPNGKDRLRTYRFLFSLPSLTSTKDSKVKQTMYSISSRKTTTFQ